MPAEKVRRKLKWELGNSFSVTHGVTYDGIIYQPGTLFTITGVSYVMAAGKGPYFIGETGKRELMLKWAIPTDHGLSQDLVAFLKSFPESRYSRWFVSQELGVAPDKDKTPTTFKEWISWAKKVMEEKTKSLKGAAGSAKPVSEATGDAAGIMRRLAADAYGPTVNLVAAAPERMIPVRVVATEIVQGRVQFSRQDTWSGNVPVPESLIRGGDVDETQDYLYDHLRDYCTRRDGDIRLNNDSYNDDDSDGLELVEDNIVRVIRQERDAMTTERLAAAGIPAAV